MQRSDQLNELATALAKAQCLIKQPAKTKTATIKSDKGSYSYKYADLPDVIEAYRVPFSDNALSIVESASTDGGRVAITTLLLHASGQWIQDILYMNIADSRPQAIGSAITYGRRYAIAAMVGVAPDVDDDAEIAQDQEPRAQSKPRASSKKEAPPIDVPFAGPPATIEDTTKYQANPAQKLVLGDIFRRAGVNRDADWLAISNECIGLEMRQLSAAVAEWQRDKINAGAPA